MVYNGSQVHSYCFLTGTQVPSQKVDADTDALIHGALNMTLLVGLILGALGALSVVVMQWRMTRDRYAISGDAKPDKHPLQLPAADPPWQTHSLEYLVTLDSAIPWLGQHRDPALWYMLVRDLNYDQDVTYDIVGWILKQPDCPNAVAACAIERIDWPEIYGMADPPVWNARALCLLQIVALRETGAGFPTDTLSDPFGHDRSPMVNRCLLAAQSAKANGITPVLPMPFRTLTAAPRGPVPRTAYEVDETGILSWVDDRHARSA